MGLGQGFVHHIGGKETILRQGLGFNLETMLGRPPCRKGIHGIPDNDGQHCGILEHRRHPVPHRIKEPADWVAASALLRLGGHKHIFPQRVDVRPEVGRGAAPNTGRG